jgi:hypothetical protein
MRIPAVTGLERDPLALVRTGDWVRVDGDRGLVEITRRPLRSDARAGALEAQSAV